MTKKRELRSLLTALPMPLAQLGKRALNAQPGLERHNSAYYLCEAALKLASAGRIGLWRSAALEPKSRIAQSLESLSLPSLGHWFGFLRDVSDALSKAPNTAGKPLAAAAKKLSVTPTEWRAVPTFIRAAVEAGAVKPELAKQAEKKGVLGFFEVLVGYRNEVLGHGAQRGARFYAELGDALLEAAAEVLVTPELFGDLHLVVARMEVEAGQKLKTTFKDLTGLAALPLDDEAADARPGQLYLVGEALRVPLYPLVLLEDGEIEKFAFLNKTTGAKKGEAGEVKRAEFLDYVSGESTADAPAAEALNALLASVRNEGSPAEPTSLKEPAQLAAPERRPKTALWIGSAAAVAGAGILIVVAAQRSGTDNVAQQTAPTTTSPSTAGTSVQSVSAATSSAVVVASSAPTIPSASVAWSHGMGGPGADRVKGLSAIKETAYAVLDYEGTASFGEGATRQSSGKRDGVVVALPSAGHAPSWVTSFDNAGDLDLRALDAVGERVVVGGFYEKSLSAGDLKIESVGPWDVFLAELARDTGKVRTLKSFGGKDLALFFGKLDIALDSSGNTIVGGGFGGTLDLGCGPQKAEGLLDGYVAKLDAAGKCLWMKRVGDAQLQTIESVAVDLAGDIAVAGEFSGTVDFGAGALTSQGGIDLFVAKLDAAGAPKWTHRYGGNVELQLAGSARVGMHSFGSVVLAGWFDGTVDFGASSPLTAKGGHDVAVVRLDPAGKTLYAVQIETDRPACSSNDCLLDDIGLTVDPDGSAIVATPFAEKVRLAGVALESAGKTNLLVAKLSPKGELVWLNRVGGPDGICQSPNCSFQAAAPDSKSVFIGGFFDHVLGVGAKAGEPAVVGAPDAFLLRFLQ